MFLGWQHLHRACPHCLGSSDTSSRIIISAFSRAQSARSRRSSWLLGASSSSSLQSWRRKRPLFRLTRSRCRRWVRTDSNEGLKALLFFIVKWLCCCFNAAQKSVNDIIFWNDCFEVLDHWKVVQYCTIPAAWNDAGLSSPTGVMYSTVCFAIATKITHVLRPSCLCQCSLCVYGCDLSLRRSMMIKNDDLSNAYYFFTGTNCTGTRYQEYDMPCFNK